MFLYFLYWIILYIPIHLLFPSRVVNRKNKPRKRAILACNHLSAIDPVVVGLYTRRRLHFFIKKELSKNWFMRVNVPLVGSIFVERGQADVGAIKKTLKILKEDNVLMIFPEGRRNKDGGEMQELKAGAVTFAVKTGACVIPVILWRKPKVFRRDYIYYGAPVSFSQYENTRMGQEEKREATLILTEKMAGAKEELRAWLAAKRPRLLKRHERKTKNEK